MTARPALPGITSLRGDIRVVSATQIAHAQPEVQVEAARHRQRVAIADAGAVGPVTEVSLATPLEVVGQALKIDAEVMSGERLLFRLPAEVAPQFQFAAVNPPIAMTRVVLPLGIHPAARERPAIAEIELQRQVRH